MLDEPLSLRQHSLRTAQILEKKGAPLHLIVSGLLHDCHFLTQKPTNSPFIPPPRAVLPFRLYFGAPVNPSDGVDDFHEVLGAEFLKALSFPPSVVEPIRLHVLAKRYLITTQPSYVLSDASRLSLRLQGGLMSDAEMQKFVDSPYAQDAIALRLADDSAKVFDRAGKRFKSFMYMAQHVLSLEESRTALFNK